MTTETAKHIGSSLSLKSLSTILIMAYLIMALVISGTQAGLFESLFWIYSIHAGVLLYLVIGIAVFYGCGYYFGGQAGVAILINKHSYLWVGPLWGLLTLFLTVCLVTLLAYLQFPTSGSEGQMNNEILFNQFMDYISWGVFYAIILGLIPALLAGIWFGRSINSHAEKVTEVLP